MTARGSAWDGGGPFDPPTAPLPPVDYWGDPSPGYVAPARWQAPATAPPHDADRRACRACRTGPWRAAARHAFCRERSNAGAAAGRGASFGLPRAAGAGPIRGVPGGD